MNTDVHMYNIYILNQSLVHQKLTEHCKSTVLQLKKSSPPGSAIPGILQARTREWVAISFSMHESEKWKWSCSVVSDSSRPHGLLPGSSAHGIFQARVLEWVAIAFSDRHVLAIVNSATVNTGVRVSFQFWFPQGICTVVGLLGHMVVLFSVF